MHTKLACAFQAKYIFFVICLGFFIDLDNRGFTPITLRYVNQKNTMAIFSYPHLQLFWRQLAASSTDRYGLTIHSEDVS